MQPDMLRPLAVCNARSERPPYAFVVKKLNDVGATSRVFV
jgi:hypothetical protein